MRRTPINHRTLFLIDTMSQVYRAFYAIPELATSGNFPTNAIFGFNAILQKILTTHQPDLVVAASDSSGPTLRHAAYAEYKAQRRPMPEPLRPQIDEIYNLCAAYGIPVLRQEGYEADDIIATLALAAREKGWDVVIISSDKDLCQLVGDGVAMLDTKTDTRYDRDGVVAKLGVPPERVVDFLALAGDASDNIPGAPGIGPKTALNLLQKFGSLDQCLEDIDQVTPPRIREILKQNRQQVLDSRELARLHLQVPLTLSLDELRPVSPDWAKLREMFTRFEFKSLLAALPGDSSAAEPFELSRDPVELARVLREKPRVPVAIIPGGPAAVAFQQAGDRRTFLLEGHPAQLSVESLLAGGRPLRFFQLKPFCANITVPRGFETTVDDAEIMHYLLYPHIEDHTPERIALDVAGITLKTTPAKPGKQSLLDSAELPETQSGQRAAALHQAVELMAPKVAELGLAGIYRELELPLVPILAQMESTGVLLDTAFLNQLSQELEGRIHEIEEKIYHAAGERFNLNSPKQLGEVLFEKLKLPVRKKTKKTGAYATGVEVLEELAIEFELPATILDYRQLAKLKSTYVDALPRLVNPATGRLHTTFNQTVASTGRLSSTNPNLQNIPVRTPEGQKIRRAFIAPPGWVLVSADYSQIELRIMAHLSGDATLAEAFRTGQDIHAQTARDVFGEKAAANPAEYRRRAKAINFGILYGQSEFGLAQELKIPRAEARQFIDSYFKAFPAVRQWIEENLKRARAEGLVRTLFGRIRPMPELNRSDRNLQKMGERIATNAPVQGTAADIIKRAMIRLKPALAAQGHPARLLLQVHDELVLECPEGEVETLGPIVRQSMEGAATLAVPLKVDIRSGRNWLEAK